MRLTEHDLMAIDALIERKLGPLRALIEALRLPATVSPPPLPHKLTLQEFAHCIQRCYDYVAAETRSNRRLIPHVQGRRPKLIHPAALAIYGVDPGIAAARLRAYADKRMQQP